VTAARGTAVAALLAVLTTSSDVEPEEHLVAGGRVTRVVAVCFGGTSPDVDAARRHFDAARPPMKKSHGYTRAQLEVELARQGGVLIDFTGRRFHSAYMSGRLWPRADEAVTGYAILNLSSNVFVESVNLHGKPSAVFYPWGERDEDLAPVCR
jgi:hypothetical protein